MTNRLCSLHSSEATFSQLRLVGQNTRQLPLGTTSDTSPPSRSGSRLTAAGEYWGKHCYIIILPIISVELLLRARGNRIIFGVSERFAWRECGYEYGISLHNLKCISLHNLKPLFNICRNLDATCINNSKTIIEIN